jgi:hypothetical protein
LEELGLLVLSILLFAQLDYPWWLNRPAGF